MAIQVKSPAAVEARGASETDLLGGWVVSENTLNQHDVQDLLAGAIDHVRPLLHRRRPLRERVVDFWAAAAAAADLAATDVLQAEFLALAQETGLADDLGR